MDHIKLGPINLELNIEIQFNKILVLITFTLNQILF